MRWRYLVWAVVVLLGIGIAAVMIPGSPLSLERTIGDPMAEYLPPGMTLGEDTNPDRVKQFRPLREWTADLASPDRDVRFKALSAIGTIAPQAGRAATAAAKLMADDPDPLVRDKASLVLSRMGAGAKPALDIVTATLSADSPVVRRNAVFTLMNLKTDARSAVPALVAAMNDPRNDTTLGNNETTQAVAASTLGVVSAGTGEAVAALTEVVAGTRPDGLRSAAVRALGVIGPPARPAIPALTALLAVKDWDMREDATLALRAMGESPPDVNRPKTSAAAYGQSQAGGGTAKPPDGEAPPKQDGPAGGAAAPAGPPEQAPPPLRKGG